MLETLLKVLEIGLFYPYFGCFWAFLALFHQKARIIAILAKNVSAKDILGGQRAKAVPSFGQGKTAIMEGSVVVLTLL